jgi:adhesin transport system membrane fusion protein
VIEGRVRPSDIAFIRVGQPALVKITAYNYATYGGLEGTVTEISPDAIETPEKPGETYFRVKVRTGRSFLENGDKKLPIGPGMTAQVSIRIGEKSLLAYILKPITKSARRVRIDEPPKRPGEPPPRGPGRPSAESL